MYLTSKTSLIKNISSGRLALIITTTALKYADLHTAYQFANLITHHQPLTNKWDVNMILYFPRDNFGALDLGQYRILVWIWCDLSKKGIKLIKFLNKLMQFPTNVLEMSSGAHILAYSTAVMSWDLWGRPVNKYMPWSYFKVDDSHFMVTNMITNIIIVHSNSFLVFCNCRDIRLPYTDDIMTLYLYTRH